MNFLEKMIIKMYAQAILEGFARETEELAKESGLIVKFNFELIDIDESVINKEKVEDFAKDYGDIILRATLDKEKDE